MKTPNFRRYIQDDYTGAPKWFFDYLDVANVMVDTLNALLAHNVDIDNNLLAERQVVTLSHATPITLRLQKLTVMPRLVRVGYAGGYIASAAVTGYNGDGTVQITVFFLGTPPTSPVATTVILEP